MRGRKWWRGCTPFPHAYKWCRCPSLPRRVPNTDTLHALIREYRDARKIPLNVSAATHSLRIPPVAAALHLAGRFSSWAGSAVGEHVPLRMGTQKPSPMHPLTAPPRALPPPLGHRWSTA